MRWHDCSMVDTGHRCPACGAHITACSVCREEETQHRLDPCPAS